MSQLQISIGQHSDKGRKAVNQDFYGVMVPEPPLLNTKGIAAAIADGISSSEHGHVAAESCVTGFLEDYFSTPESWSVKQSAQKVLTATNSWLYSQGRNHYDARRGLVCTLSAMVIKSTTAYLFHAGDTRIYRLRGRELRQLTNDHRVWIAEDKNYLGRAMGADIHLEIDYQKFPVNEGDSFIFITDGIFDHLNEQTLNSLLQEETDDLDSSARLIVNKAYEAGSSDNLTCQIIRIDTLPNSDEEEVYQQLTELPFPPELYPGMILDGYKILREIHASKRTQIYLAVDTETESQVILKTPSVNYEDDPAYIEQFLLEDWIARRINNPHVLRPYDQKREKNFLYNVNEFLDGQTLRQWMHDHPAPDLEQVRDIVEQIAKGLQAFHRLEMLHQDLKPENIMIDRDGLIKIIDFGSTKVAGIAEITAPFKRYPILGTLNFTAPEYLLDQPGNNRSDIYSLGVIAYELLTGKLPYGDKAGEAKIPNAQHKLRYTPIQQYVNSIPQWVNGAIEKAVQIMPDKRYGEISEFLYDLRHPNSEFIEDIHRPLLERNPTAFWKVLSLLLFIMLMALLLF